MKNIQLELPLLPDTKKERNRKRRAIIKQLIEQNPNIPEFNHWFYEVNKERVLWKDQPLSRKKAWTRYKILVENGFWEN
tara:strand:- start:773 stop:1009 length:237 start_codon:yes stop_codon:yes gene_type:complete